MIELEKNYDAATSESEIYQKWLDSGYFNPDNLEGEAYTIIMPPPNVTGTLHVGHALTTTVEDILIRFKRMRGYKTLWLPGTDHAAIATQSKVEKLLEKEGIKKRDLGRERFLEKVQEFAQNSHDTILTQLKSMGASADWSREAFTLDEKRSLSVRTAFKRLYELGLIYQGYRVINWDVKGQTTISDDEIVYVERPAKLYTFKYNADFPIAIATTRPETKLGDTAVAVNPEDPRYKQYVGQEFNVEFFGENLRIKVIADESIDINFGTGALGVTPAHSMTDYELAQKHSLPIIPVIDERGKMAAGAGHITGKKTLEAREIIVEDLKKRGLLEKEEDVQQNVGTAERTGGVIEPLPKLQWFINVDKKFKIENLQISSLQGHHHFSLKELMHAAVKSGDVQIIPEHFNSTYFHWIENLRDWCISRQIWYGHRIPVWYDKNGTPYLPREKKIIFVRHGQSEANAENIFSGQQDPDLTKLGVQEAEETAQLLANVNFQAIFSSDLKRAEQTAKIIAEKTGNIKVSFHEELKEVYGGKLEGSERGNRHSLLVEVLENNIGETAEEMINRAKRAWEIINKDSSEAILIVGHNSFFCVMKAVLEGVETKEELMEFRKKWHMTNGGIFEFSTLTDPDAEGLRQDEDTLDTWFSAGLWSFSTLGWPEQTLDLETFHPTSVLETGYDILFFWVARMILMTTSLTGEVPFKKVLLHGLIRDADKKKMSKSKGNVIDPLDMTAKYGTDALRFALVFNTAPGTDMALAEDKIKGMKHFGNKLWNIARFILQNNESGITNYGFKAQTDADKEILSKLDGTINDVTNHIENFRLHEAAQSLYQFVWYELADKYIEASKEQLVDDNLKENTQAILNHSLITILKLLHPFMPFVTEEIWSKLGQKNLLIIEKWPKANNAIINSIKKGTMEETNNTSQTTPPSTSSGDKSSALHQLEMWLDHTLGHQAPQLPANWRETIVKIVPWLTLIILIIALPAILVVFGIGTFFAPFAFMGGFNFGGIYLVTWALTLATFVLEIIALPGLFHRKYKSWQLVYYATLIGGVSSVISMQFGGLIGMVIGLYILFQIRSYYK